MKTSIALCTYNGEKFLNEQLHSFLTQTKLPDELIVCDDCSTDKTEQVVAEFSSAAPFTVKFIKNRTNLGSTKNFEQAVSLCSGNIIFLSDQDDFWLENKIELILAEFERNKNAGLIFSDAYLVDENMVSLNKKLWDVTFPKNLQKSALANGLFQVLIRRNVVTGATLAFRAELLELLKPFPTHIPDFIHDAWMAMIFSIQNQVKFINRPLIKYRQHSNQQLGVQLDKLEIRKNAYDWSINYFHSQKQRNDLILKLLISKFGSQKGEISRLFQIRNDEIDELINHYQNRRDLPKHWREKSKAIYKEYLSGRYTKHSKGIFSVAKDLVKQ